MIELIELVSLIISIGFFITFIFYVKHNDNKMLFIATILEDQEADIKALQTTIQKDREQIADYLNEITKNSK